VAHVCYLGGLDREDCGSQPIYGKLSFQDLISTEKWWAWWHMPSIPTREESTRREYYDALSPGQTLKTYF
jgi:hypothetical protein